MSTFERMLEVLGARESRGQSRPISSVTSLFVTESGGKRNEIVRRRRRSGRLSCRDGKVTMATERLEQRQLLAVTTFAQAPFTPASGQLVSGWATVVAEGGDDIYIQQVAGKPESLWIADNSSFINRAVVGGPATGAPVGTLLPGVDVNSLSTIQVTSGTLRRDVSVLPAGYPMVADYTTRFTLASDGLEPYDHEVSGTISIVQPDGRTEYWKFSNGTESYGYTYFSGDPKLTAGIGVSEAAKPGDYYPTAIRLLNTYSKQFGKSEIEVVWNVKQLPVEPLLTTVRWYCDQSYARASQNNGARGVYAYQNQSDIRPSAGNGSIFIPLPNAAGPGLSPILPATFSGTIVVDGVSLNIAAGDPNAPTTLYFNGETEGLVRGYRNWWASGSRWIEDDWMHTVRGRLLTGTQADGYRRGIELTMSGDFPVQLESARYALPSGGDPVTATIFAGQNITSALDVNLVQPGSAFHLDSPVLAAADRNGISVRASAVDFNAAASTSAGLTVGPALVDSAQALESAFAVAQLVDGKVTKLLLPSGGWGAGYDADNPPTVRIDSPEAVQATATVTGLANGRVISIDVNPPGGSKYATAPSVTISAPTGGGRTAQVTATVSPVTADGGGAVTGITVTDAGSGYNRTPIVTIRGSGTGASARANIVGSIATGVVQITNSGSGYTPNSKLPLTITGQGTGAAGFANVDTSGMVKSIEITSGGDGYGLGSTQITIPAPPTNPSPQVATATAIIDPATTRIVDFVITNPGAGYGRVPTVTISPPLAVSDAIRPLAAIDGSGRVTGVTFGYGTGLKVLVTGVSKTTGAITNVIVQGGAGGSGYAVGDLANIDSGVGGKGQAAQFRVLEVDRSGGVLRVELVTGGAGYGQGELLTHAGSAGRGYGYKVAPRVYISRPDAADGIQAEAVAAIDTAGRITGITITKPGSGYKAAPVVTIAAVSPVAQAETLRFNTSVAAKDYKIELADDPSTVGVVRTTLFVSNSGSLAGNLGGTAAADTIVVQSRQGDVLLEGAVFAGRQSYLLQSGPEDQTLMPFRFTTTTAGSSTPTGWIKGGTVAVTLANDLDTPEKGAVAYNVVSLRTQLDSIRIRAAKRSGATITEPFPYQLSLSEYPNSAGGDPLGSIAIDAVAASSFPIVMKASGNMDFNAALATAGGLTVFGVNAFTVTAPVSTTKGQIKIDAAAITVKNSLQVTNAAIDEAQQDIVLNARNGDVTLDGGYVSAQNRVVINQKRRVPVSRTYSSSSGRQTIADRSTASMSVSVPAGLSIDDINVALDVTHSDLSDLSATLVAPDGSQIQLFATNRLQGANLSGTIFDSEAEADLPAGKAPYTGSFRPGQSLSSLYSKSPTGTWTVRVADAYSGDTGTLDGFRITLRDVLGSTGGQVSGTSRVKADTLVIDAEGSVGKSGLLPGDDGFYLMTDVDTVIAHAGGSIALSDVSDLDVNTLVAGGLVSLRAEGVDPVVDVDGKATTAALRGTVTDVKSLDLSAPGGSIAINVNTASTILLGNAAGLSLAEEVRRDRLPSMVAAGSVSVRSVGGSTGGDFVVMDAPLAGSGAKPVRIATAIDAADVTYYAGTAGIYASTITAKVNGAITNASFGRTVASFKVGDRILVANRVAGGDRMNGVYAVSRLGGATSTWQLTRVADGDTAAELPANTIVGVQEGQEAGSFYRLAYAAAGSLPFGAAPMTAIPFGLTTNIGSIDPNDTVSFVVSTADGTNTSPGSLGKMIKLRQANTPSPNESQATDFLFSPQLGDTIKLTQELPRIVKPFTIDGSRLYPTSAANAGAIAIDGSRIDTTRDGNLVGLDTTVDGIVFGSSLLSTSGGPTAAEAAALRNIVLGGFNQGTAVIVDGVRNVQVDKVVIGEDISGGRLGVRNGVVVTAAGTGSTDGVTISRTSVSSAGGVGVSLAGQASGVRIFGNTIGKDGRDNVTGVAVTTSGATTIGDKDQATNVISYNGTGIRLAGNGSTTVANAVVTRNVGDGIVVTKGSNTIGSSAASRPTKPASPPGNIIAMNRGWGVRIAADTNAAATDLARQQQIWGNFFVEPEAGANDKTKENTLGAVGLSAPAAQTAVKYEGDGGVLAPRTAGDPLLIGVDQNGNQHFGVGDNLGPMLTLQPALGASGGELDPATSTSTSMSLTGAAAGGTKSFVLTLQDSGSGVLASTVDRSAFALSRDGVPLAEGKDYLFVWTGDEKGTVRFDAPGKTTFDLGNYQLTATAKTGLQVKPGTFTGGLLTDKVNNTLRGGRASFVILLVGASAPTDVRAEGGDSQAVLTWIPPTDTGDSDIVDYVVQSSTDSGSTWQDRPDAPSSAASATVSGLTNGTSYVFRVAAVTAAGRGKWSLPSGVVKPGFQPASAPGALQATPGNTRVDLAWVVPVSDGGKSISDYVVESSIDGEKTWRSVNDGVSLATTAAVTGLTNGTAIAFRVAAVTSVGRGEWSDPVLAVVPRGPATAPLGLVAVGANTQAVLAWSAPSADGGTPISDYAVQRSSDGGRTWVDVVDPVTATTGATVTGLTNGTAYVFRVAARTAAGLGAWTAASTTVVPMSQAGPPRSLVATGGNAAAMLTWQAPVSTSGAPVTDYVVQRSVDGGQTWATVPDGVSVVTGTTVTGLTNGAAYVFRVAAVTAAGTGAWSAVTSAVVPRGPATAPQNVQATAADGRVILTWNTPASLGGSVLRDYVVQSSTNGGASWSNVADGVSTATTATVTGLVNGTPYVYRVAAVTDFATGAFSAATAAVVPLAAPGAISGLVVQPTTSQVALSWQAPVSTGGRPVIDYTIEYQAAGTATWTPWAHAPSAATSAVITGLTANTGYLFRVRAVTSFTSGQPVTSTELVVLVPSPTQLLGRASSGSVTLSWLPPRVPATTRIIDYRVQYSVDGVNWLTAADGVSAASRTTVRGLTNGTAYLFRVAAVTVQGIGSYSATSNWLRPVGPVRRA